MDDEKSEWYRENLGFSDDWRIDRIEHLSMPLRIRIHIPTSILPDVPTASQNQPSSKPWCGYSMDRTSERRDARWSRWFQGWNAKTVESGTSNPNNTHNLPKLLMDVVLSMSPSWSPVSMYHESFSDQWMLNHQWSLEINRFYCDRM